MKNLFFSLMAALGLCSGCTAQDGVEVLTPQEFIAAAEADSAAVILDVRQPDEFAAGHLAKAINLDWLNPSAFSEGMAKLDKDHTYYIYCRSGRRSNAAASKMKRDLGCDLGFDALVDRREDLEAHQIGDQAVRTNAQLEGELLDDHRAANRDFARGDGK